MKLLGNNFLTCLIITKKQGLFNNSIYKNKFVKIKVILPGYSKLIEDQVFIFNFSLVNQ